MKKLFLIIVFICSGCNGVQKFKDVSMTVPYSQYANHVYSTTKEMYLSGVNAPPGYRKIVNYYTVGPTSPSWSGPELVTRVTLPIGTKILVESVNSCTNCVFGLVHLYNAKIKFIDYKVEQELQITIPLQFIEQTYFVQVE